MVKNDWCIKLQRNLAPKSKSSHTKSISSLLSFVPFVLSFRSFDGNGAVASVLVCRTLDRDVKGSILTGAVLCPLSLNSTGPSCSKLTTSLVNVSLKFQTLILQIHCYFLLKKCENPLHCKGFSHFFNKK